jgi:hypothetical protein
LSGALPQPFLLCLICFVAVAGSVNLLEELSILVLADEIL